MVKEIPTRVGHPGTCWRGSEGWLCPKHLPLTGRSSGLEPKPSSNSSKERKGVSEYDQSQPQRGLPGCWGPQTGPCAVPVSFFNCSWSPWRPPHDAQRGQKSKMPAGGAREKVEGLTPGECDSFMASKLVNGAEDSLSALSQVLRSVGPHSCC